MSFSDLKITELKKVAEAFGVSSDGVKTKQEIIALLEEEGITAKMYEKFTVAEKQPIEVEKRNDRAKEKIEAFMFTTRMIYKKIRVGNPTLIQITIIYFIVLPLIHLLICAIVACRKILC